ncbi:MAG: FAD-dependent oxidoreductase [Gammaproteobacteria bacterium]|jgi:glycerol-3-phosphate dehydrogenase|nr:FAD-dependent oxidoreductase [Gammaproteobacteria bacterium]MBQ0775007.1 FAD-dependent oxidoreductase [Gammaproteobacteria bacterium]|tara:strand:+ start:12416 stop:13633 length:1218 start_codon:yes stop_codon:yes gene_type:complete
MTKTVKTDIAILGGGIAGLWMMNILRQRGYSCVLLETNTLGGQQTLLSQGIIHGGLKYALSGTLSNESEAIAGMPDRWRKNIAGNGDIDLKDVRVLSDTQYLWSAGSVASRFTTFFASKMLRGRIEKLPFNDYPPALKSERFKGNVYRMDDLVIDTPSLLRALIAPVAEQILRFDANQDAIEWNENGIAAIRTGGTRIEPSVSILAAGAGNAALLDAAHTHGLARGINAQIRPLHMLVVKHTLDFPFYAHCIGASNKPRLTVTTHSLADGSHVWYLGGDIAERGVDMSEAALIAAGKKELSQLFPWIDFSQAEFAGVRIDRAEPAQNALAKPDNAFAQRDKNLIVSWPTKLTLAPDLGDRVTALLADLEPSHNEITLDPELQRAALGTPAWHNLFGHGLSGNNNG